MSNKSFNAEIFEIRVFLKSKSINCFKSFNASISDIGLSDKDKVVIVANSAKGSMLRISLLVIFKLIIDVRLLNEEIVLI